MRNTVAREKEKVAALRAAYRLYFGLGEAFAAGRITHEDPAWKPALQAVLALERTVTPAVMAEVYLEECRASQARLDPQQGYLWPEGEGAG
jgi:hypothetical protein